MTSKHRHHPKELFPRRAADIFEEQIEPHIGAEDEGKYLAIDIESGAWEMDADEMAAGDRLLARVPDAQMWVERIGYSFIHRFGHRIKRVHF